MKTIKLFLLNIVMMLVSVSYAQVTKPAYLIKVYDSMDKSTFIAPNRKMVVSNEESTQGFSLTIIFSSKITILTTMVGIGNCNEDDKLLILFDNGERLELTSWKDFNCEGESYFTVNTNSKAILMASPMSKIRITNGRTFDSFTGDVETHNKNYFIDLFRCNDTKTYVNINQ